MPDEVPNFSLISLAGIGSHSISSLMGSGDPHLPLHGLQFLASTLEYQNDILSLILNLLPSSHTGYVSSLSAQDPECYTLVVIEVLPLIQIPQTCHPPDCPL